MGRPSKTDSDLFDSAQNASDREMARYGASLLQSLQRLFAQRDMRLLAHMCALAVVEAQRLAEEGNENSSNALAGEALSARLAAE